jgi:quercetin dioxygenase-like cupin family protein
MSDTMQMPIAPPVVHTAAHVEQLPWEDLHGLAGVRTRVLWRDHESIAGILDLAPGVSLPEHAHIHAHHDVSVLDGECRIVGTALTAGSFVHIPGGVDHAISDVGPTGCRLLYLYLASD